jgi:hypothetical protein
MATFEIGVWTSYELHNAGPGDPMYWLKEHITQNIELDTSHSVSIYEGGTHPDYPAESGSADSEWPGYYEHPCTNNLVYYNNGGEWWTDYHACKGLYEAADANLLVINHDSSWGVTGGACGESKMCLAEGHRVGDWSYIEDEGCGLKYAQMYSTVLHELGHAITPGTINGYSDEKAGNCDNKNGANHFTPMVTKKIPNACDNYVDYVSGDDDCWAREYSNCVKNHMEPVSQRNC